MTSGPTMTRTKITMDEATTTALVSAAAALLSGLGVYFRTVNSKKKTEAVDERDLKDRLRKELQDESNMKLLLELQKQSTDSQNRHNEHLQAIQMSIAAFQRHIENDEQIQGHIDQNLTHLAVATQALAGQLRDFLDHPRGAGAPPVEHTDVSGSIVK